MKGLLMFFASVAVFMHGAALFAGNTCTWQGGSGKFSDANWDTAPVSGNGDTIRFDTTNGVAITVENDIADDFSVSKVFFATKNLSDGNCGKVTFTGKSLMLRSPTTGSTSVVYENGDATSADIRGPAVEFDVPVTFYNRCSTWISSDLTFNKKVTVAGSSNVGLFLWWPNSSGVKYMSNHPVITFMDEVYAPDVLISNDAGMQGQGSDIYYYGKVTAKEFTVDLSFYDACRPRLYCPSNAIGTVKFGYGSIRLQSSPCLGTNTIVQTLSNRGDDGTLYLLGDDVVCNRITGAKHQTVSDEGNSRKLTMRASATDGSGARFIGKTSLVYDPQGDHTYTLTDSDSTTTGSLEIKGGTFKLAGTTSFSALSEVVVRSGAVLDLSESTAAAPFASTTKLTVDVGGAVVAPAGGVTFSSGTYRGLPLVAGGYSTDWVSGGTVTITSGALEADTRYWANPSNGDWDVAANWTPAGVPSATETAVITVQGASNYTVRMEGTETKPAKIVVGTDRTAKATLSIAGEAAFTKDTLIEVNRGGEISVPEGGRFVYDMEGAAKHATLIKINNGRFVVDGGYAMVTNTYGVIVASGAEGEILVSGGELVLADKASGSNYGLSLKEGATLRMTGGTISIPARWYNSYLDQAIDGVCDFSGGTLFLKKVDQPNQPRFSGDVSFSGSAAWTNGSSEVRVSIAPKASGQSMTFSLADNATMAGPAPGFVFVGGLGDTTFRMDSTGTVKGAQCNVGIAKGTALYRQTAGYSEFSWRGLCAGMTRPRDPSAGSDAIDNAVTGVVEIVGGAMCVGGETSGRDDWGYATYGMFPSGTVVGYGGTANPPASGRPYVGRMAISGTGSLTNRYGHLLVGVAPYGEGSLVLDGGTLRSTCERLSGQNDYRERIACAVGVGGGKGEFLVKGGDCAIFNNVWIGGVATNAVRILAPGEKSGCSLMGYPYDTHGGEGLLEVSGGSVAFGRDLVVGAEGTGVVSVVGSAASQFTVARNLVLSNAADVVGGGTEAATLRFKPDAGGITPISVAGKFVVADKAKLDIDLAGFDMSGVKSLRLLTCSSKEGNFDPARVALTGCQPGAFDVHVTDSGIYVSEHKGTIMIVF